MGADEARKIVRYGPVTVPLDHIDFLRAHAIEADSSVSREIRRAIRLYVEGIRRQQAAQSTAQPPAS